MAMMVGGIGGAAAYNRIHLDGRADHVDARVAHIDRQTARAEKAGDLAADSAAVAITSGPLAKEKTLEAKVAKLLQGEIWQQQEIVVLERQIIDLRARLAKAEARR